MTDKTEESRLYNPLVCAVCFQDYDRNKIVPYCQGCQHETVTCGKCCREYIVNQVESGISEPFVRCPHYGCNEEIDYRRVKSLLTREELRAYEERTAQIAITMNENYYTCPFQNCQKGMYVMRDRTPSVNCPFCHMTSCRNCNNIWHEGMTCEEFQRSIVHTGNERASLTYISTATKQCPRCRSRTEKDGGCNHITCKQCKHEYFWCCLRDYRNEEQARLHRQHCA